jgi:hypothetical protein
MLRQTEKNSVGIRLHVAILGLGRNSGASGDFQLTRSAPCFEDAVFKTLIAEVFSWTKPDVCQVDGRRPAIRSPEANGGGVSASRFAGTCRMNADQCRKCVIAPPTESRRWPETPSSVRQIPLGRFVGADDLGRSDRCRQIRGRRPLRIRARVTRATGVDKRPKRWGVSPSALRSATRSVELGSDFV